MGARSIKEFGIMIGILITLTGGIGLFLLGMVLLTDGFKAFAGEAPRQALVRFTGTPFKAFGSGALVTIPADP